MSQLFLIILPIKTLIQLQAISYKEQWQTVAYKVKNVKQLVEQPVNLVMFSNIEYRKVLVKKVWWH